MNLIQMEIYGIDYSDGLLHVGNKNSGRYRRGSGDRPWQHDPTHSVGKVIRDKTVKKLNKNDFVKKIKNDAQNYASKVEKGIISAKQSAKDFKEGFIEGLNENMSEISMQQAEQARRSNEQQFQQFVNQEQNRLFMEQSIRDANRAASLSMTYGMNPFMFG